MYLLYADGSGTTQDASQQYFVLAGFCVFERQGYWISEKLDAIAARFNPADPASVELHGSPMLSGGGIWRRQPKPDREQAICDVLQAFMDSHSSNRIFASVIKKISVSPQDPVEFAFEQLTSRFDHYLPVGGDVQGGLAEVGFQLLDGLGRRAGGGNGEEQGIKQGESEAGHGLGLGFLWLLMFVSRHGWEAAVQRQTFLRHLLSLHSGIRRNKPLTVGFTPQKQIVRRNCINFRGRSLNCRRFLT